MTTPTFHSIPLAEIKVIDRQRLDYGDLDALCDSLSKLGQIQPILLDDSNRLIAGGRRFAAATKLGWTTIQAVKRSALTEDELFMLELEENIQRKDMTWQEKCLNIKTIHDKKVQLKAIDSQSWGQRETGAMLNESAANINFNLKIAKLLLKELDENKKPLPTARFWNCGSLADALRLQMRDEEDALRAELLKRQQANVSSETIFEEELVGLEEFENAPTSLPGVEANVLDHAKEQARTRYLSNPLNPPDKFDEYYQSRLAAKQSQKVIHLSGRLHNRDCIDFMLENQERFDHIITDIPYGIDLEMLNQSNIHGGMKNIDTVEDLHDVSYNESLMEKFFSAGFHCLKDHSFLITWCDQSQWQFMFELATEAGFAVQKWPIIWSKTYQCMNNCIGYNFTKDFEIAMICRKKGATIQSQPQTSIITAGRDELQNDLGHPFSKPFAIWEFLARSVALPGQSILDPFAGRGSGVISFLRMGYNAFGVELDPNHYAALYENVKQHHYLKLDSSLQFT
jgi:ParB family chromosome partitioning protein